MNGVTALLTVVVLNCSAALSAWAENCVPVHSQESGLSKERLDNIDHFYQSAVEQRRYPGVVILVARHGKIARLCAIGTADADGKQKLQPDAIYRLYSMTKPIASVALMMLYEEGRFQLNDPVEKYLPEFHNLKLLRNPDGPLDDLIAPARPPTIADILRHTGGFTSGGGTGAFDDQYRKAQLLDPDTSIADVVTRLANLPLRYEPGSRWTYSIGPDIAARLVEVLSGKPMDVFLRQRLFDPLGMKDTGYFVPPAQSNRLVAVFMKKDDKLVPIDSAHCADSRLLTLTARYTSEPRRKGGTSGLVSTAEDYWRFAQMLANGGTFDGRRYLSPATIAFMVEDHLEGLPAETMRGAELPEGLGFGLGFAVVRNPAATGVVSSRGSYYWSGAAGTVFWVDPKEDLVVVGMIQNLGLTSSQDFGAELRSLVYAAIVH